MKNQMKTVKARIYADIIDLAQTVFNGKRDAQSEMDLGEGSLYPGSERNAQAKSGECSIDSLADHFSSTSVDELDVADIIKEEWDAYLLEAQKVSRTSKKGRSDSLNVLDWWKENKEKFPHLSVVARCLLGSAASAATVEVDNGLSGLYTPKNRASTAVELVDMKIFVRRNKAYLNFDTIKPIPMEDLKSYYPPAPSVPFIEKALDDDDDDFLDDTMLFL